MTRRNRRILFGYCPHPTCWVATNWYKDEHGLTRCGQCRKVVRGMTAYTFDLCNDGWKLYDAWAQACEAKAPARERTLLHRAYVAHRNECENCPEYVTTAPIAAEVEHDSL